MDDMKLLREMRADVPSPAPEGLTDAHARLMAEAGAGRKGRRAAWTGAGWFPAWRRPWRIAVAGTAFAAVAAAVVFGPTVPGILNPPEAEAVGVLQRAARAAAETAPRPLRDDQFVYLEFKALYQTTSVRDGHAQDWLEEVRYREWHSVDGTREGLRRAKLTDVLPMRAGDALPPDAQADAKYVGDVMEERFLPCETPAPDSYAGLRQLPTDPDDLHSHLRRTADGEWFNPLNERVWDDLTGMLTVGPVPADLQAALFLAAAKIPGVTMVGDTVDAAGREGVAVGFEIDGVQEMLIFDRETFRYLGFRAEVVDEEAQAPVGTVVESHTLLETKVVDQHPTPAPGTEGWPCPSE